MENFECALICDHREERNQNEISLPRLALFIETACSFYVCAMVVGSVSVAADGAHEPPARPRRRQSVAAAAIYKKNTYQRRCTTAEALSPSLLWPTKTACKHIIHILHTAGAAACGQFWCWRPIITDRSHPSGGSV